MKYALILSLCLASGLAQAEPWTKAQQWEYAAFTLVNTTDWLQTADCARQAWCEEQNPLLSKRPQDHEIIIAWAANQWIYYQLIEWQDHYAWAEPLRWIFLGSKISVVWSNDYQGLRIDQAW